MIDLHYWPTPNGWKVSILLEELGLPYRMVPVDITRGAQFTPEFLAISPNNRMPAIVDHAPADGGAPISVFESGAILLYLAEKTGRFLPSAARERKTVLEWLMWQIGGLGPMSGQNGHFRLYAPEPVPYAITRYAQEVDRLYAVLDLQLGRTGAWVAGQEPTVADFAIFPWVRIHKAQQVDITRFAQVQQWHARMAERPAVQRGVALGRALRRERAALDDEARAALFGQTAQTLRDATQVPRQAG